MQLKAWKLYVASNMSSEILQTLSIVPGTGSLQV